MASYGPPPELSGSESRCCCLPKGPTGPGAGVFLNYIPPLSIQPLERYLFFYVFVESEDPQIFERLVAENIGHAFLSDFCIVINRIFFLSFKCCTGSVSCTLLASTFNYLYGKKKGGNHLSCNFIIDWSVIAVGHLVLTIWRRNGWSLWRVFKVCEMSEHNDLQARLLLVTYH